MQIREAILEAALEEFETKGFSGTDMADIAARASVSRRDIYRHFLDKEAVFSGVLNAHTFMAARANWPEYSADFPVRGQLTELLERIFALLCDGLHLRIARTVVAELARNPGLAATAVKAAESKSSPLYRWIDQAMEDGGLRRADPVLAYKQLLGLARVFSIWPMLMESHPPLDPEEIQATVQDIADLFLSHYGVPGR